MSHNLTKRQWFIQMRKVAISKIGTGIPFKKNHDMNDKNKYYKIAEKHYAMGLMPSDSMDEIIRIRNDIM